MAGNEGARDHPLSAVPLGGGRSQVRIGDTDLLTIGRARMYVCGITPYDTTHLGHAATFVWSDVAARVLRLAGATVEVCRNITDVDDVLVREAGARHTSWRSLATQQTYRFEADMAALGVTRPAFEPHARDYVDEVIALAQALLAKGAAYEKATTVWFRGAGVAEAAGLSGAEALRLLAEHDMSPAEFAGDDPLDVPVWVASSEHEPAWASPWGPGRPGWHAECAAMALAILGPGLDLHTGGEDLTFPHHAYESAMAEAASGVRPFARAWLHVGSVRSQGSRMAKSTGNLVLVHDLIERFAPEIVRLAILDRRYDEAWEFEDEVLQRAADRLQRLWHAAGSGAGGEAASLSMREALFSDLDVPRALDVAEDTGGPVARELLAILGLV